MTNSSTTSDQTRILVALANRGWVLHTAESGSADNVLNEIGRIGDLLGTRVFGRGGALHETVQPKSSDEAHPRSLSAEFGLRALPFHIELSHRLRPCRYLLLGCVDPGLPGTETMLLDWRTLGLSPEDLCLLEEAPVFVRTGRRSFYSTILPPGRDFLRYDPCCLEAVDERGQSALKLMESYLKCGLPDKQELQRGDILIVDNWRVLHARGPSEKNSGRRLVRILIDA